MYYMRFFYWHAGIKKEPAMEIAGLCLPLKPQKERGVCRILNNLS